MLALFVVGSFGIAFAAEQTSPGQALQITPPVIDLTANPGQTVIASIKVTNIASTDLSVSIQANDFVAEGEQGEPKVLLGEGETSPFSLRGWVVLPAPAVFKPQESRQYDIQIQVPAGAEPGGHFGVIRFSGAVPELEGSNVGLSASLGSLVLISVSGEVKESLKLEEFFAGKRAKFFETGPIQFGVRLRNDGTVHLKPAGQIEIFNLFGGKVATVPVNPTSRNVLPSSIRKFDQTWDRKWSFGPYKAKLSLNAGKPSAVSGHLTFWVVPYKAIGALLLFVLVAILAVRRWKGRKRSGF